jgi:uncharacterized protein
MNMATDWPTSLDDAELEELDRFLRARAGDDDLLLDGVHGLLTALAVGPTAALPDEWLPEILNAPFADQAEGNRVLALLAKLNDSIPAELDLDAYEPILGEIDDDEAADETGEMGDIGEDHGPLLSAAGWCEGFSRGIDLRAGLWENRLAEDPQLMELLGPIMALAVDEGVLSADTEFEKLTDEEYDVCLAQVSGSLGAVARYWRVNAPSEDERRIATLPRPETAPPRRRSGHWLH